MTYTTQKETNWNFLLSDIEEVIQASFPHTYTEIDDHVLTVELNDHRTLSVWQPRIDYNLVQLDVIQLDGTVHQSMGFNGVSDEVIASLIVDMIARSEVTS